MQETFMVKILYRQNATWQGTVEWIAGNGVSKTQSFRSALELIRLIDSTDESTGPPGWEAAG